MHTDTRCCKRASVYASCAISCQDPQTMQTNNSLNKWVMQSHAGSDVAWPWVTGLIRCLSLTVSLSQEGGSLVDPRGVLRLPLYTAWLELYQKEVTFDL